MLKDVCEAIVDCEHKTAPTQETGLPSIRTPNIGRGRLILEGVNRVSEETYKRWTRRAVPQAQDLILAREAPVGNVAIIPPGLKVCLGQRTVLIRPSNVKIDPEYLTYLLLGDEIQGRFWSLSNGATVGHLNVRDIRNLPLPELPSLDTQRKIAGILSAYDDLIENNNRRIKILEEMARLIYREWFVHFRFPGHEKVRMVESELGLIPEGWETLPLSEVYRTGSGGTPSRKVLDYFGGSIRWVKTQELRDSYIHDTDEKITDEGLANSSAKLYPVGAVLMAMYGATIGKLGILATEASCNQACCAMIPKRRHFGPEFLFLALSDRRSDVLSLRIGAAQQNISQLGIKAFPLLCPSDHVIASFARIVEPLFTLLAKLQAKNTNLRQTRDLLLPRLVSGELDVSDLDIEVPTIDEVPDPPPDSRPVVQVQAVLPLEPKATPEVVTAEPEAIGTSSSTPSIDDFETDEVMAAFRQAARNRGTMSRDELLKRVSKELGYKRFGSRIEKALRGHLRAAIRRKIIGADGDDVWLETPSMNAYGPGEIIDALVAVMRKGAVYEREEVVRAVANHLGFRRLRDTVEVPIRSAINRAIRRGVLGYEGTELWRED